MKKLVLLLLFSSTFLFSQTKVKDTVTRKATIDFEKKGNKVIFKSQTPLLNQMAGAPPASYSYFWEFGDGSYSKEKEPKKVYKKKGEYKVNLAVTNNYDNGKPPTTRPKIVAVNEIIETNYSEIASLSDTTSVVIFNNREPVIEEEMVVAITYQNNLDYVANGKLYLFYNDKEFKNKSFELLETRTHFGEREIQENTVACVEDNNNASENIASSNDYPVIKKTISKDDENLEMTLLESKSLFLDSKILEFDGMNAKETRTVFFTFKTTPEMIKDTSATVRMRGVYVPDRNYKNHKKKTLEMEIVTSHDPNKMSSNATFMNYRTVRLKTINFKTKFQNNGEGPAKLIRLETDIPEMFDKKTLKIVDSYPKCPICPKGETVNYSCLDTIIKKDQIHFTFKNIYIPGSNQKNVKEIDSTKGFVKYSMKFAKDFHKVKTKSKTAIIFDKNEPVITNYATTRFKPGISVGAKAGYNYFADQENPKSYFVGATISPYKSYRFYWQSELYFNHLKTSENGEISPVILQQFTPPILLSNGTVVDAAYTQTSTKLSVSRNFVEVVPISLRYNINNYVGIGVGPQLSFLLNEKTESEFVKKYYAVDFNQNPPAQGNEISDLEEKNSTNTETNTFKKTQASVFADATFGFARIGPSIGIRYYKNFEKEFDYWQFYAIWKF